MSLLHIVLCTTFFSRVTRNIPEVRQICWTLCCNCLQHRRKTLLLSMPLKVRFGSMKLINTFLKSMTPLHVPCMCFILCVFPHVQVRIAVAESNYHMFFQLLKTAPAMIPYLMDFMVTPMRVTALQRLCKAFRPSLNFRRVQTELGYEVGEGHEVKIFFTNCGCIFSKDGSKILTKDCVIRAESSKEKSSLI